MHTLLCAASVSGGDALPMGSTGGNVSAMHRFAAHLSGGRIMARAAAFLTRSGFLNPLVAPSAATDSAAVPAIVQAMRTGWRIDQGVAVMGGRGSRGGLGGLVTLWIGGREIYHNALRGLLMGSEKIKKKGGRDE